MSETNEGSTPEEDSSDENEKEAEDSEGGSAASFAGSLLVAHPSLRDPNFRRSVLYLSAHTRDDGAFGIVLNRPLGTTAADLLPHHEQRELLKRVPVYHGGPVGQDQLSFTELRWEHSAKKPQNTACQLRCHLGLDEVATLLHDSSSSLVSIGSTELRAVVGYAGWSGGQLEAEMKQRAWILTKPMASLFAQPSPAREEKMWFRILSSLGPAYKLLAAAPDDPSLN